MMNRLKSHPFVTTTIEEYLWNMTDPILEVSQKLAPSMVPTKNVGILHTVNYLLDCCLCFSDI